MAEVSDLEANKKSIGIGTMLFLFFFVLLVGCAAWVRFAHITEVGLGRSYDNGSYIKHARLMGTEEVIERFAPLLFFTDHLALRIFGDNDYAVKSLRAFTDMCVLLLLIFMAYRLTGDRWMGLSAGLLYAFATQIVKYARTEMAHAPATLVLLLAFFALITYMQRKMVGQNSGGGLRFLIWLVAAGLLSGTAMTFHPSLCFVGPVFVLCIGMLYGLESESPKRRILGGLRDMALFTTCFFLGLVLLSIIFYAPTTLLEYLQRTSDSPNVGSSVWSYSFDMRNVESGPPARFTEGMSYVLRGLRWIAGGDYSEFMVMKKGGLYPALFFGTIPIMVVLAIRQKKSAPAWAYALVVSVFSFALLLGFFLRVYNIGSSRYMIPFFPIAILAICWWYHAFARSFIDSKRVGGVLFVATIAVFAYERPLYPGHPGLREPFTIAKEFHDIIGDKVDNEHRLLALPYGVSVFVFERRSRTAIWLSHDYYFGDDAVWPREVLTERVGTGDVPLSPSWITYKNATELFRASQNERIRYVFVSLHADGYVYYRDKPPFDEKSERLFIRAFLEGVGAEKIYYSESGILYELPELDDSMIPQVEALGNDLAVRAREIDERGAPWAEE